MFHLWKMSSKYEVCRPTFKTSPTSSSFGLRQTHLAGGFGRPSSKTNSYFFFVFVFLAGTTLNLLFSSSQAIVLSSRIDSLYRSSRPSLSI